MSHIPAAAMKHAAPHAHDAPEPPAAPARPQSDASGLLGWSLAAVGATLVVGVIAAAAGPLARRFASPSPKRKRGRARKPVHA